MKRSALILMALVCLSMSVVISCKKDDPEPNPEPPKPPVAGPNQVLDSRDNQIYNTVTIGTQVWMAQNLNYNLTGSLCPAGSADSCAKYGRLYNSTQLTGVAISGWHVPTEADWQKLELHYGMSQAEIDVVNVGVRGNKRDSIIAGKPFNALYAGYYNSSNYINNGTAVGFWTSNTFFRQISTNDLSINKYDGNGETDRYISIRLIKD